MWKASSEAYIWYLDLLSQMTWQLIWSFRRILCHMQYQPSIIKSFPRDTNG